MRSSQSFNITLFERLVAVFNYLTFGMVGFIYLILSALKVCRTTSFLQYHIFLIFFLDILYYLLFIVLIPLICKILSFIPVIRDITTFICFNLYAPLIIVKTIFVAYLCITALCGLYSYVPWVSKIIRGNIRQ